MSEEKQTSQNAEQVSGNAEATSQVLEGEIVDETGDEGEAAVSEENALIEQLREELSAAQAKADDYLDKLQRSAAEFQNSRRRLESQLADEVERANGALIRQLLPVLDDLDLAFQNVPADLQKAEAQEGTELQVAWLQGFRQIRKKLLDLLGEQGVAVIDTSGEFDPNLHEAISSEPSDTVPSGHIIAEVRAGYTYKGRVLRPALVRVAM
jgi:molecular chaperone GrpE